MSYASLQAAVADLERAGDLVRVRDEVDPHLELAAIQRRLYAAAGPAVLFENVRGTPFPVVANLYGTLARCRFLFRGTLNRVCDVVRMKADPGTALRRPWRHVTVPVTALRSLPWRRSGGPVLARQTSISQLPAIVGWPDDGGPFITLPQVLTEHPDATGVMRSNVGMYRVQLRGNEYEADREVGLHYQIHRGIGVHHEAAIRRGEPMRVSIFVGGPPAHTFAAVMPLPEGLSELLFAGMLAGRRFRWTRRSGHVVSTEADFCIVGTVDPHKRKPEGPFGDHLGYYSLRHDYPVLDVEAVWHRDGAIWPFTSVGRPPQEDTSFGALIHEITAPMVPREIPGLRAMRAVDAAGVHPLLLAIGSERYVPQGPRQPREILTIANAILGFGQASLAKYVLIAAGEDDPRLDIDDIEAFLRHALERVDWARDLHFHTRTTIDTLDYTGTGVNEGSKVVIAAAGDPRRQLATELPKSLRLPSEFPDARLVTPGVLVVEAPAYRDAETGRRTIDACLDALATSRLDGLPLVVLVDDAQFAAGSLRDFLWVAFTRSNPSHDVHGIDAFVEHKHWGCRGSLVIDARTKPHHAPPLVEDVKTTARVERWAAPGNPLHGLY